MVISLNKVAMTMTWKDPEGQEYTALMMWCPGCNSPHSIEVNSSKQWQWDGNLEAPTISPSILVTSKAGRCHSFVKHGTWQYLPDCTHSLAGHHVPLPELPAHLLGT